MLIYLSVVNRTEWGKHHFLTFEETSVLTVHNGNPNANTNLLPYATNDSICIRDWGFIVI